MSMNDLTSDMLTRIRNAVRNDAKKVTVISNKLNRGVAGVLKSEGYINEFEYIDDHRAGKIVVELNGRINKCGVISPRFDVGHDQIEKWVGNLLPARQFGHIILTTSMGISTAYQRHVMPAVYCGEPWWSGCLRFTARFHVPLINPVLVRSLQAALAEHPRKGSIPSAGLVGLALARVDGRDGARL